MFNIETLFADKYVMQSNRKLILTVSFSIFMIGISFVHYIETNMSERSRGLASTKKKGCGDLMKIITSISAPESEIATSHYETLFRSLFIKKTDSSLIDYVERHNLVKKEYEALISLKTGIYKAVDELVGKKISQNLQKEITQSEKNDIANKIKYITEDSLTYVHSCRGHSLKKQNECLSLIKSVILDEENTPYTKRFLHVKKKTAQYRKKMASEETISVDLNKKVMAYKAVKLACTSQVKSERRTIARRYFVGALLASEFIASSTVYIFNNQDDDLDREWLEAMVEDVLYNTGFGFIQANIVALKAGLPLKTAAEWLIRAMRDYPAMLTYSKYLAPSQEELEAKARELMNHPHFVKQLESLLKSLEDKELITLVNQEIQRYQDYDYQDIPEQVKEENIERLSEVLARQAYLSEANGVIKLGDLGHDYYAFNRVWDLGATIETVGLSAGLLKFMCINQAMSMKTKAFMAATVYAVNKLALTSSYQALRDNQLGH